jgi:prepilin-type N-terminal cleavage/methylation domain-containing protein
MQLPERKDQGFTLVELLIVVAIIGILAAIAIPQFSKYRTNAYNSAAQSDLRNLVTYMESEFASDGSYNSNSSAATIKTRFPDAAISDDVTGYHIGNSNGTAYAICTSHTQGDKAYFMNSTMTTMNSTEGGSCSSSLSLNGL